MSVLDALEAGLEGEAVWKRHTVPVTPLHRVWPTSSCPCFNITSIAWKALFIARLKFRRGFRLWITRMFRFDRSLTCYLFLYSLVRRRWAAFTWYPALMGRYCQREPPWLCPRSLPQPTELMCSPWVPQTAHTPTTPPLRTLLKREKLDIREATVIIIPDTTFSNWYYTYPRMYQR